MPRRAQAVALAPAVAFLAGSLLAGVSPSAVTIAVSVLLAVVGAAMIKDRPVPKPEVGTPRGMPSAVLDGISDAVLLFDEDRTVVAANRAAQDLLGTHATGRDLALSLRHPEALEAAHKAITDGEASAGEIVMHVPMQRVFLFRAAPLPEEAHVSPRFLIVLREVTDARNAEQIRADFVANVSHELRSPLTSLVGFIETLRNAAQDDDAARERFLDIMGEESQRMARLIDDLLSLSRVEANEHVRPDGEVAIADLLAGVVDSVSVQAAEKEMEIELIAPDSLPHVTGDRDELIEVFQNLAVNAVKYGRDKTPVRIAVSPVERIPELGGRGLCVAVIDKGEGIEAADIPRLTERFYRVDKGRSRSMGGTGLGLAIVKHIVNRHRGRLVIRSDVGEGSQFIVYLPVSPAAEAQVAS